MSAITHSFNYGALEIGLADRLRAQAQRILSRVAQHTADLIETGRDLAAAKAAVGHGEFSRWVESELRIPMRTAQGYMNAAAWADNEGKGANFALLQPTTVQRLGSKSCPKEVREEVLVLVAGGTAVADKAVAAMVSGARSVQREQERKAKGATTDPKLKESRQRRLDRQKKEAEKAANKIHLEQAEAHKGADAIVEFLETNLKGEKFIELRGMFSNPAILRGWFSQLGRVDPLIEAYDRRGKGTWWPDPDAAEDEPFEPVAFLTRKTA